MKKKILIINPNQFGYSAGHKYYCEYLRNDFEIDYLCFDKNLEKITLHGVNVIYLPYNRNKISRLLSFIFISIKLSYKNKYNWLFIVRFKFIFLVALLSKAENKLIDIRTGDLTSNIFIRKIRNLLTRISTIPFNKVITISENLKDLLKLPESKTNIIPLGAPIISSLNKSFEEFNLLYVGTLNKRRIEDTIIGVEKFYTEYGTKIKITYDIIGFGKNEDNIKKLITKFKMDNVIKFHGRKNHEQLKEFFDRTNIGVCYVPITDFYDVQPSTKIFEYALSGLYTIATKTKENIKYISEDNGVLCNDNSEDFYNALVHIYIIRENIKSYKIRKTLLDYQWENIVSKKLKPLLVKESL